MRKHYVLILSILSVILTLSCVSAVDNDANIVKEQNTDVISINEQDSDSLSLSEEEDGSLSAINENNSTILTINDGAILASDNNSEVLTVSSSDDVLSTEVSVTPLSSSNYKTPTKKQRTFYIGGYKAVISVSQYNKLNKISSIEDDLFEYLYGYLGWYDCNPDDYFDTYEGYQVTQTGLTYSINVKTNKFVKVKVKIKNKWITKKSRVWMTITYGEGQTGLPNRYSISLYAPAIDGRYERPFKVLGGQGKYFTYTGKNTKVSTTLKKLNSSKLYSQKYLRNKHY